MQDLSLNRIQERVSVQETENEEARYYRNAEVLFANKDWSLARAVYAKLHENQPAKFEYLEKVAICNEESGELENARIAMGQLLNLFPGFKSYVVAGNFFIRQKNFIEAKKYYMKAICHQEEDFVLLFELFKNLGNISLQEGDFEQAEEYYNKAQRIFSGSDILFVNYGSLYLQMGKFEESQLNFEQALNINPKSDKARLGLSLLFKEQNEKELAWANLRSALDNNPSNISALKMTAQWGLADYRYDVATDYISMYIEKNEFHKELNVLLACIYFQAGFREESYWECQKILAFEPTNQDALKLMQILEKKNG